VLGEAPLDRAVQPESVLGVRETVALTSATMYSTGMRRARTESTMSSDSPWGHPDVIGALGDQQRGADPVGNGDG
jgi:hypothetical protein